MVVGQLRKASAQRILRTLETVPHSLTKRYEPVFKRLAVVKVSLRLATYQHARPPILAPFSSLKKTGARATSVLGRRLRIANRKPYPNQVSQYSSSKRIGRASGRPCP